MSKLGERLKRVRKALRESQKGMSTLLNIGTNAWARYENGHTMPGADLIEALTREGLNGHWLVTGEGYPLTKKASPALILAVGELEEDLAYGGEEPLNENPKDFDSDASDALKPHLPALMRVLVISAQRKAKQRIITDNQPCWFSEVADLALDMYDALIPFYADGTNTIHYEQTDWPDDVWLPPQTMGEEIFIPDSPSNLTGGTPPHGDQA